MKYNLNHQHTVQYLLKRPLTKVSSVHKVGISELKTWHNIFSYYFYVKRWLLTSVSFFKADHKYAYNWFSCFTNICSNGSRIV